MEKTLIAVNDEEYENDWFVFDTINDTILYDGFKTKEEAMSFVGSSLFIPENLYVIRDVHTLDEWTNGPNKAVIKWTPELCNRIRQLNKIVHNLDVYCIQDFRYDPSWIWRGSDFEDHRYEGSSMKVTKSDVYWSAYIKHTNIEFESEPIPLNQIPGY